MSGRVRLGGWRGRHYHRDIAVGRSRGLIAAAATRRSHTTSSPVRGSHSLCRKLVPLRMRAACALLRLFPHCCSSPAALMAGVCAQVANGSCCGRCGGVRGCLRCCWHRMTSPKSPFTWFREELLVFVWFETSTTDCFKRATCGSGGSLCVTAVGLSARLRPVHAPWPSLEARRTVILTTHHAGTAHSMLRSNREHAHAR